MHSIWCNTPIETFFHCLKQFLNLSVLMPYSASAVFFCFGSSTLAQFFPLRTFFHPGKQRKDTLGKIWCMGRGCTGVMLILVKNCWTLSTVWAGVLVNHPSWNEQTCWKSLQKKFTKAKHSLSQQCQLVHWSLIQMGCWNTHLAEENCTTRGPPSRR